LCFEGFEGFKGSEGFSGVFDPLLESVGDRLPSDGRGIRALS
jgi:hypothetical protein